MSRCSRVGCGVVLTVLVSVSCATGQTLRELARAQALKDASVVVVKPAAPVHLAPKTLQEMGREATVVVVARLVGQRTFLDPGGDRVLTNYFLREPDVVTGQPASRQEPTPGVGRELVLTVLGGEVLVDGVTVRTIDQNREPIIEGSRYLLFLFPSRSTVTGEYEVYNGGIFDVSTGRLKGLFQDSPHIFAGTEGLRLAEARARLRGAGKRD